MNDLSTIQAIEGLKRMENISREKLMKEVADLTKEEYHHNEIYGKYCTIHQYVACPPEKTFEYMANIKNLEEWTYSMRHLRNNIPSDPDLYQGYDALNKRTKIFCKAKSHRDALTVDYHCAWDQSDELWMVYLNRIIPAQTVLNKQGSVIIWTNCYHPYYEKNPYPEKAPKERKEWVGDLWVYFAAGHNIEMQNLKKILENKYGI